jgi:hypothetical protein
MSQGCQVAIYIQAKIVGSITPIPHFDEGVGESLVKADRLSVLKHNKVSNVRFKG